MKKSENCLLNSEMELPGCLKIILTKINFKSCIIINKIEFLIYSATPPAWDSELTK